MQLEPTSVTAADVPPEAEPPVPTASADLHRWRHTRLRRRMLEGTWDSDLRELVNKAAGTKRLEAWKMVDLSANVFASSMSQVAVQYDRAPYVLHADPMGQELAKAVHKAGYWRLMPRVQRETLGCREAAVRLDVIDGTLVYRPAHADRLVGESTPGAPDRPAFLREAIEQKQGDRCVWTWEEWDVTNPLRPRVRVVDERGADVSRAYLRKADGTAAGDGGLTGSDYTWRYEDGRPFVPYVLHHAATTGKLWDPYTARELVAGSLNIALMWSFWGHIVRNAAWAQRYGINVRPLGASLRGEGEDVRQVVEMDPAMIALFEADSDDLARQVVLSQFATAADPMVVAEAIALFERRVAAFAGISPSDVQRVAGDPRSGFALAISREGQREAQVRFEPQFEVGDHELLRMSAALLWRAHGIEIPSDGYDIRYQTLPLNAEEREALRKDTLELLAQGLISKVEAYQRLNPSRSDADSVEDLERIAKVNATVGTAKTPQGSQAEATALASVVEKVESGAIPRDAGAAILARSFGLEPKVAEQLLGSAGLAGDDDTEEDEPTVDDPASTATAQATPVADTALNGAQVQSAKDIVLSVAKGELPRDTGVAMLEEFFQLDKVAAERVMGTVGKGFAPSTPTPTPTATTPTPALPPEPPPQE